MTPRNPFDVHTIGRLFLGDFEAIAFDTTRSWLVDSYEEVRVTFRRSNMLACVADTVVEKEAD